MEGSRVSTFAQRTTTRLAVGGVSAHVPEVCAISGTHSLHAVICVLGDEENLAGQGQTEADWILKLTRARAFGSKNNVNIARHEISDEQVQHRLVAHAIRRECARVDVQRGVLVARIRLAGANEAQLTGERRASLNLQLQISDRGVGSELVHRHITREILHQNAHLGNC